MNSPKPLRLPCLSPTLRIKKLKKIKKCTPSEEKYLFPNSTEPLSSSSKLSSFTSAQRMAETRYQFFETLKSMPSSSRKGIQSDSPADIFLKECQAKCLTPLPIGLSNDSDTTINLANYTMGDNYAEAFAKSLKHFTSLEKLNISSTSLSPRGTSSIISNISLHPIKELSLKDNQINYKIIQPLVAVITKPHPTLKYLNLENTKINDRIVAHLCEALVNDRVLNFLGLAKNALGFMSCISIKNLLLENQYLKQLDLHWNNIKDIGAVYIFEGLLKNDSLKELDLSWNSIGKNRETMTFARICKLVAGVQGLAHLDLSFNFLTPQECVAFGEALKTNHDLVGIHLLGNQGYMDAQGFVVPDSTSNPTEKIQMFSRLFDKTAKIVQGSSCWICESWKEMKFVGNAIKEQAMDTRDIYIHLECDGFKPDLMKITNGQVELNRVIPPGEIRFFFSFDNSPIVSSDYSSVLLETPILKDIEFSKDHIVPMQITSLNSAEVTGKVYSDKIQFKALPRQQKSEGQSSAIRIERVNWTIEKSIFKDYKVLDKSLCDDCLDFDWKESRLTIWIKSLQDLNKLKHILRQNYYFIIETFKILACQSGNEYFTIGSNVFTEFLSQLRAFDSLFSIGDLGVNWNTVIVPRTKQPFNPGNSLVRYEFMELLVRISHDRYVRSKICGTINEGFSRFLEDCLREYLTQHDSNVWRKEHYAIEDVDIVIKIHRPILENIYKRYSGKKTLPGQKVFMSFEEYRRVCLDAKILPPSVPERDLEVFYGLAMMVQVDQVYRKRHVEMDLFEFIEAVGRLCWHMPEVVVEGEEKYRDEPPLPKKLENALAQMISLCSKNVKENFVFPTLDTYKNYKYIQVSKKRLA